MENTNNSMNNQVFELCLLSLILLNETVLFYPYFSLVAVCILLLVLLINWGTRQLSFQPHAYAWQKDASEPLDLKHQALGLVQDIKNNIELQVSIINQEIHTTNTLVQEAAQGISTSFTTLQHLANEQQESLNNLMHLTKHKEQQGDTPDELASTFDVLTEQQQQISTSVKQQIQSAVANGVRLLQFEDLTSQILTSIIVNTASLTQLSDKLTELQLTDEAHCLSDIIALRSELSVMFEQASQSQSKKSVNQTSMEEGDVELF